MEEPTPTNVEIFPGMCSALCRMYAMTKAVEMVLRIMGSDCLPVCKITFKFKPNPSRITAHCSIFLEVNLIPASKGLLFLIKRVMIMPARIAMTAPPMMGKRFPKNHEGIAMHRQIRMPFQFFFIKSMIMFLLV